MDRKKMHKLLDLVLDIHERGIGENGYPYVSVEFSNYGSRIFLCAQENGFVADGNYDLFDGIATDKQLDDAIVLAKVLLEKAVDMVGK
ncbi:hypothetical protein [Mediterraneibacter gnavus]|jgi:hypothetical protein|uniref:Uncharacterized protein n=1 Tax=Mediterraneibacter gnavus (strain ATCC 29149 / DSM 114966 / JCM 6515 / VPI C7-9) TaxID=411470 RepID=A7B3R0_MEDG7|nr:hypothetical protein [Mediterraneibacter gnavus]EDN77586.1 hypothetical protein RUMGNA_02190 [Mediterraneibacter gnavus ATCC 29149]PQL33270.1 hypothetical protein C5Y99_16340 [Mediterraneibacter gnavus ATCC 29149]QEI32395.1 hypothetical protein FXV78_10895 [Mediterraneibacter gnavus ATCC 29149]QHB24888.1 hypothetical protein RGna_16295 [Mediterraneibacter gnavus ATCC 29149]UZT20158.1 hypothetical protein ORL52_11010 [Mediterraneibacter gnavus]